MAPVSGKTTLLGALLGLAPDHERLLDAAELVVEQPHLVRLVTRTGNVEGTGSVGLRDLVRLALRMRPDRLVVTSQELPDPSDAKRNRITLWSDMTIDGAHGLPENEPCKSRGSI